MLYNQAFPYPDTFQGHTLHDEGERFPGKFVIARRRVELRKFEASSFQTLVVQQEPVTVPLQELYALAVLAEEDKYVT